MFYLFIATLCSATIALIFKYTESSKTTNRYLLTSSNYFICFIISLLMALYKGLLTNIVKEQSFFTEFKYLLSQDSYVLSPYSSTIWGIITGIVFGAFFFLGFYYYQKSVRENGVGITGTFGKLGILIPVAFSIIIWKEIPTLIQWIGIILSIIAIIIVNLSPESLEKFDIKATLILFFLFGGMSDFSNKVYQKYALNDYKDVFLFSVFFVAFLVSMYFTLRNKTTFNIKDMLTGFAVGIPNLFSSYFLILSLDTLKASVAYPLFSAGGILLINVGGYIIFKEKISRKNKFAIGLIVAASVLINI